MSDIQAQGQGCSNQGCPQLSSALLHLQSHCSAAWPALLRDAPRNNPLSPFLWASGVHGSHPLEDPDQFKSTYAPTSGNAQVLAYSPSLSLTRPDPVLSAETSWEQAPSLAVQTPESHAAEPAFNAQPWLLTSQSLGTAVVTPRKRVPPPTWETGTEPQLPASAPAQDWTLQAFGAQEMGASSPPHLSGSLWLST